MLGYNAVHAFHPEPPPPASIRRSRLSRLAPSASRLQPGRRQPQGRRSTPIRKSGPSGRSSIPTSPSISGSCVYGGIWVGKNSPIPNINGYRRETVDYLKELGVPVLRWPGGCFSDDYHWRDGVGPAEKRPKTVNTNWGGAEDNSFGTNEFMGFCKLIGAAALPGRQRRLRLTPGNARLDGVLQLSIWQHPLRSPRRRRLARALQRPLLGRRQRTVGLRR